MCILFSTNFKEMVFLLSSSPFCRACLHIKLRTSFHKTQLSSLYYSPLLHSPPHSALFSITATTPTIFLDHHNLYFFNAISDILEVVLSISSCANSKLQPFYFVSSLKIHFSLKLPMFYVASCTPKRQSDFQLCCSLCMHTPGQGAVPPF